MTTSIPELDVDGFLEHYGVPGMKWGRRKGGTSRKTEREAKRDARETAQAKMYYGEGAGVRRRHINNAVASKSKDPAYKEAFERHYANQDLAKAGEKARSQRKRKNASNSTRKTVRGIGHIMKGNAQYASVAASLIVGGAMYAHKTGIDKVVIDAGKEFVNSPKFKQQSGDIFDQIRNFKG